MISDTPTTTLGQHLIEWPPINLHVSQLPHEDRGNVRLENRKSSGNESGPLAWCDPLFVGFVVMVQRG